MLDATTFLQDVSIDKSHLFTFNVVGLNYFDNIIICHLHLELFSFWKMSV